MSAVRRWVQEALSANHMFEMLLFARRRQLVVRQRLKVNKPIELQFAAADHGVRQAAVVRLRRRWRRTGRAACGVLSGLFDVISLGRHRFA